MKKKNLPIYFFIGVGLCMGSGVGVALKNLPVGLACGTGIGIALYFGTRYSKKIIK